MDIIEEIEGVVKKLDEIQEYTDGLSLALSSVDSRMCDLRHGIEHNNIKLKGYYRLFKEFKKLTLERRKIRNDMELSRTLNTHLNKLLSSGNREFLVHELKKANGKLNQPYKNRIYTEEQMNYFLGRNDKYETMEREQDGMLDKTDIIDD